MITQRQLESLCVSLFQDLGWEYAHGPDIALESYASARGYYRYVVSHERLLVTLRASVAIYLRTRLNEPRMSF